MAYKNQKKNKAHNKELHLRDRQKKRLRKAHRHYDKEGNKLPSIDELMKQAGLM
jgi:hypothetical protein